MSINRKAFDRINYGLFLVSAAGESQNQGCIVNSLHQVSSARPPKFSLTLNKSNETYKAIQARGTFAATVLSKETPKELIDLFGYKSGRVVNKFEGYEVETDGNGNPYIKENALARFACKIVDQLDLGSYVLLIAEAVEAEVLGEGLALTLDDFRDNGGSTPPTATVVRSLDEVTSWKCTVCGYIAYKDELPDDYRCPLCRAPKDKFVKQ